MSFTYKAPDAPATTRTVDPVKVHIASGQWYLQGWCHLREAMRTFHLDRVSDVRLTDIPIAHGGEPVPDLFEPSDTDAAVELAVRSAVVPLLADYLDRATVVGTGAIRTAQIRVADATSLRRVAARHGGDVEVRSPDSARAAVASWAEAALDQYR